MVEAGACPMAVDADGRVPAELALLGGHVEAAAVLEAGSGWAGFGGMSGAIAPDNCRAERRWRPEQPGQLFRRRMMPPPPSACTAGAKTQPLFPCDLFRSTLINIFILSWSLSLRSNKRRF